MASKHAAERDAETIAKYRNPAWVLGPEPVR